MTPSLLDEECPMVSVILNAILAQKTFINDKNC